MIPPFFHLPTNRSDITLIPRPMRVETLLSKAGQDVSDIALSVLGGIPRQARLGSGPDLFLPQLLFLRFAVFSEFLPPPSSTDTAQEEVRIVRQGSSSARLCGRCLLPLPVAFFDTDTT